MLPGAVYAAQNAYTAMTQAPPPVPRWSTRMTQHDSPVTGEDLLFGCCCIPCSAAMAKSTLDKTNPLFNFCCFTPCGTQSWVRHQYGIEGVCGDDLAYGLMCPCCSNRQIVTETRLRGAAPNTNAFGANTAEWSHSLFDCDLCDFVRICFCMPCMKHEIRQKLQPSSDSCCYDVLCIVPTGLYGQVRHSYGIVTDFPIVEDLCLPLVCFLCAFNRAHKQVMTVPLNGGGGKFPQIAGGFLPAPGNAYRPM